MIIYVFWLLTTNLNQNRKQWSIAKENIRNFRRPDGLIVRFFAKICRFLVISSENLLLRVLGYCPNQAYTESPAVWSGFLDALQLLDQVQHEPKHWTLATDTLNTLKCPYSNCTLQNHFNMANFNFHFTLKSLMVEHLEDTNFSLLVRDREPWVFYPVSGPHF